MTAAKNVRLESINKRNCQESVAELSAQGLSDARIAERLGVTVRTIERDKRELREVDKLDRVARIKFCETEAQKLYENAEALQWEAAELIATELAEGKTQRELAKEIGKSQMHVSYMSRIWKIKLENPGVQERSFNDLYQEVKGRKTKPETESEPVKESAGTPNLRVVPPSPQESVQPVKRDPETGQELQACGNPKSFEFKVTLATITIADHADDLISRATDRLRNLEDLIEAVQEFEKVWRDEYVPKHPDGEDTPDDFDESPLDVLPIEGTTTDDSVLEAIELVEEIVNQKYFVDDLTEKQREALDHLVLSINKLTTKE